MKRRTYQGPGDVALLQAFNANAIAETAGCGYLHPGDIPHRLFNGNKFHAPSEVLCIWEDNRGIAGWLLTSPRHQTFDAQVRPDLRGAAFEREVLAYAEQRMVALMQRHGIQAEQIYTDAFQCDTPRAELLAELGWSSDDEPPWVLNRARLVALAEPILPLGYTIRPAAGLHEAAELAAIHAAAFGSTWTPALYRTVMQSPGYAAEREFVVEVTGGALVAFTVTWHDLANRTGLFEPVGVHPDHRRRGLGKALLLTVMRRMTAAGLAYATVVNQGTNHASRALYHSCGFQPWHLLNGFVKSVIALASTS